MLRKRCKAETFGLSLLDLLKRQTKRKYNGAKFILRSKCLAMRPVTWTWSETKSLSILRFYVCLNLLTAGPFDLTPIPLSSFKFFLAFGGEFGGRLLDRIVLLPLFVDLV